MSEPQYPAETTRAQSLLSGAASGGQVESRTPSPLSEFCKRLSAVENGIQIIEGRVNTVLEQVAGIHKDDSRPPDDPEPGVGYGGLLQDVHRGLKGVETAMSSLSDRMNYLEQI